MPDAVVVIDIVGEGRADVGREPQPKRPNEGILPILTHKLCGKPANMRVVTRPFAALQGKGLDKKVQFVKRQAFYSGRSGAVFVMDSEGDLARRLSKMVEGRDRELPRFPMAIGVAHPCIEAWLFTDPTAIRRGLGLEKTPNVTEEPEALPAPCQDGARNPKTMLRDAASALKGELSSKEKDQIAAATNDMSVVRNRCPQSFAPFAEEVESRIRPLF